MSTYTRDDVLSWRGRNLVDNDGDKIGKIDDIYLDRETDQPDWAVVTTGLFGMKRTFVPLQEAQTHEDDIRVPFEKATVKDAPRVDPDGELTHEEERTLYAHYGRNYRDYDNDTGDRATRGDAAGPGQGTSARSADDATTRSEDEARTGETGRVRLKRYVVEDQGTETPVRREEVRVERETITDSDRDRRHDGQGLS